MTPKEDLEEKDNSVARSLSLESSLNDRVSFDFEDVKGSFNLVGPKIDDLIFPKYENEIILSPSNSIQKHFIALGWIAGGEVTQDQIPNEKTRWSVQSCEDRVLKLFYRTAQNVTFQIQISYVDKYLFEVTQSVYNNSGKVLNIAPYSRIYMIQPKQANSTMISHEGFLGEFEGVLNETKFEDVKEKNDGILKFDSSSSTWSGIGDKYWLSAILPNQFRCKDAACEKTQESEKKFSTTRFVVTTKGKSDRYQVDNTANFVDLKPGDAIFEKTKLFVGAKEIEVLDKYKEGFSLKQFDKALDFGIFYFLTKPIFLGLHFLYDLLGNFGICIILLTIIIKTLMLPLSLKSIKSMAKMKLLMPEVAKIKDRHKNDKNKMAQNKEIVSLYANNSVNPIAGIWPLLMQIPVFFALYKVFYICPEMRGAEFVFWIKDLSKPDPTSIFNIFGLLSFSVPQALQIGVLPILFGITMFFQQKLSPQLAVEQSGQSKTMMKVLPFIMVFLFSGFPSGMVLYWIVNNCYTILQTHITQILTKNQVKIIK